MSNNYPLINLILFVLPFFGGNLKLNLKALNFLGNFPVLSTIRTSLLGFSLRNFLANLIAFCLVAGTFIYKSLNYIKICNKNN